MIIFGSGLAFFLGKPFIQPLAPQLPGIDFGWWSQNPAVRSALKICPLFFAGIVVAFALAKLAVQKSDTPDAPYIGWVESLIAGIFIVVGAAWLGHVGGKRGVRWSQRRHTLNKAESSSDASRAS